MLYYNTLQHTFSNKNSYTHINKFFVFKNHHKMAESENIREQKTPTI